MYRNPPAFLLNASPVPEYTGTKWADVVDYAVVLQVELNRCNWDKEQARQWASIHE